MRSKIIYERVVWFEGRVKSGEYPNATGLAKRFEVSIKTAQRDIEFMRDRFDCPLEYDSRRKGYFYSDKLFSLTSFLHLTSQELSALLIARKLLEDINSGYAGKEISSVVGKVSSLLEGHGIETEAVEDKISLMPIEHIPAADTTFRTAIEGCVRQKRLRLSYYSAACNGGVERLVDPYHLYNYAGTWHLLAFCNKSKDMRDFVLGRILDIELLQEGFSIRKGFNAQDYLGSAFGICRGGKNQMVTLRFAPQKAGWIKGQLWHKGQEVRLLKDGSLELSFPVAEFIEIKQEVLKHGSGVKVIRPRELAEDIRNEAKKILEIYGT